jgi:hypothetical protein
LLDYVYFVPYLSVPEFYMNQLLLLFFFDEKESL